MALWSSSRYSPTVVRGGKCNSERTGGYLGYILRYWQSCLKFQCFGSFSTILWVMFSSALHPTPLFYLQMISKYYMCLLSSKYNIVQSAGWVELLSTSWNKISEKQKNPWVVCFIGRSHRRFLQNCFLFVLYKLYHSINIVLNFFLFSQQRAFMFYLVHRS